MKKRFRFLAGGLFLLFLLTLLPVFPATAATAAECPAPTGADISVMSFNVLNNNSKDSDGNFLYAAPAKREDAIAAMIKAYKPDIIGFQEAGPGGDSGTLNWCSALNTDLKSIYAYRSLEDDTGLSLTVYRGLIIFYNKTRFTLVSSGGQGYSDPANSKRAFQWVKLRDKNTNTEFYVFNTHWQYEGSQTLAQNQATRATQAKELAAKVNSLAKNHHFFITGDFNSSYVLRNSTTKCDGVNIGKLMENENYRDGLVEAPEKYAVDAAGNRTALATSDSSLQTCFDHVVYHEDFYTPLKMEKIQSRTYSTKLSDHDAILVHFRYNTPSISVSADRGQLDAYYSDGAYYIDNLTREVADIPITAKASMGAFYTDAACSDGAGTALTIKTEEKKTYRPENTLYLKYGGAVVPVYLRSCNINTFANAVFVDRSMTDKADGATTLYCDKWYCRLVTKGVNGFSSIQDAVDAAGDGYQVLVAPGTYYEDISYTGKSLKFYGQNRTNIKALVLKDGVLTVNSSKRTYETYLSGSITYDVGSQQAGSLMVNGFHFIDRASVGQIRILGGSASTSVDLRISNNLFNCYTDGAASNGSVVHGISAVQKTGSIEDNYFHLTKIPTYVDSSGKTVNYTNRGITLRNLKDLTINANYFDGYTGSKMRPFWLSSEVSSGSTTPGYGNIALTANRLENCYPGSININNIRGSSNADILIAGNSYDGQDLNVSFSETANQTAQNLPTDKSKIRFRVQSADYPSLNITPSGNGITCSKFSYYVTFRSEDEIRIYGHAVVSGTTATYSGPTPTKAATAANHYSFKGWVNADGAAVNLSSIKATTDVYASFTATAHSPQLRNSKEATCTEAGYTGDSYCSVCNYCISKGSTIPAKGHSYAYTPIDDRCHSAVCRSCAATAEEAHSYVDGICACGAKVESLLSFKSATVTLESDLSLNYYVAKTALEGFTDPYVSFQKAIYDESGNVSEYEETTVSSYTEKTAADGTECYVFTFTGISAKEMSSAVSVTLSGSYEGTVYSGNAVSYSVKQYAENLLAATEDAALRTLLVDMLNYGAEAQSYFAYNTANLANAGLTEEQKAWASQEELSLMSSLSVNDNEGQSICFESAALLLEEKVTMHFYLDLDEYTGTLEDLYARVFFENAKGDLVEYTIEGTELTELNGDYVLYFDGLNAAQMRSIIGVELYSRQTASCVSQTLYYSIESYAHNKLADASLAELVTAMMRYGDSVAAYAAR